MNSDSVKELKKRATTSKKKLCTVTWSYEDKLESYFHRSCALHFFFNFFIITIIIIVHHLKFSLRDGITYYASLCVPRSHSFRVCAWSLILLHALYDHLRALRSSFNRIRIFLFFQLSLLLLLSIILSHRMQLPVEYSCLSCACSFHFFLVQSNVMRFNLKHLHPLVVDIFCPFEMHMYTIPTKEKKETTSNIWSK